MKKLVKELDRRNLLRYLGSSIVALPFMRVMMETQAFGEVALGKRAVFFHFPDGIIPAEFHPSEVGTSFVLKAMTKPLEPVRADILMLKNLTYRTGSVNGETHRPGMMYALTGVPNQKPGISIDTYLGEKMKANTTLPVLRVGVASGRGAEDGDPSPASFFADGKPSQIEDNPTRAFQAIFGSGKTPNTSTELSQKLRKSLLDDNLEQIKALQTALGSVEKKKLDVHIEAVRELERRIGVQQMESNAQCTKTISQTKVFASNAKTSELWAEANFDVISDLMNELTVQALACGATRVVYIQNSAPFSEVGFSGGIPSATGTGHHSWSHYLDLAGGRENHIKNQAYMMGKFANLLKGLAAIKEGDKSLLNNTAAMAFTEFGDSDQHSYNNVGVVLAGQAGGAFKTGRCIDVKGASHNQVLVSILQAMGLPDQTFGQADLGTGPLVALKE